MSNWKIVNLQDVNDSAAGRLDGLEVRMARNDLESRDVGVSLFRYGPNVRNPMSHQHREQEEAYVVVSGSGRGRPEARGWRRRDHGQPLARRGGLSGMHDAFVVEAQLELDEGFDPAAVGAAVTTELCGHWEHEGPCHWPHNSAIDAEREPAGFRTVFVADEVEAEQVRGRVEAVLGDGAGWRLVSVRERAVTDAERPLADRLLSGPRAS